MGMITERKGRAAPDSRQHARAPSMLLSDIFFTFRASGDSQVVPRPRCCTRADGTATRAEPVVPLFQPQMTAHRET